ncbi:MAG: Lead, cadmium, zinc and mercury transporting ATPase (EC (EC; Copper-translocating P-type ATPase (EC [uncultured Thiotrichaceae bacterium]|uniref:P-type Zn(2+) transporter n=1 Tax=uncultured Thiotrichaceae bacterium TaxID=298394 RepID=A0A6S6TQV5_9GAMM|nr:MAG: Lead, cadmium, zinc and mercury transporting ATPase (EC (EC; Copper-translocating P-type ATPase (EC [uncultured Thiotrichaceae bacterium]
MLIELTVLFGSTYWLRKKRGKRKQQHPSYPLAKTRTDAGANKPSLPAKQLLQQLKQAVTSSGREQLQLSIDPELPKAMAQARQRFRKNIYWSMGAISLALLSNVYPVLYPLGVVAVLYIYRVLFVKIAKDLQQGRYLTTYVVTTLMLFGMIATGNLFLAALIAFVAGLFAKFVDRVEGYSQQSLTNVFQACPAQVWVLRDGVEIQVDLQTVTTDDKVVVNSGEVIPVDGRIESGIGYIDERLLTGEGQPVEKSTGEPVFAATLLLSGRICICVERTGEATTAAKIGHVLEQTQNYKDTLITRGRQTANRLLPVTFGISALTLPLLGPVPAVAVLSAGMGSSLTFLGPMSILSYLQILSRRGILVKDGRIFEALREVDTVVFDKTGTLTLEQPTVGEIHVLGELSESLLLRYAAIAEYRQPHPIARAILKHAEAAGINLSEPDEAYYAAGFGIRVKVDGLTIRVGSKRFMQDESITLSATAQTIDEATEKTGHSLLYISTDSELAGILELQPTLRPEAQATVDYLKKRGVKLCIISGDHEEPTRHIAETLGIEQYFAGVLPEDKAELVHQLREQGGFVCFVGDGINDAIALKTAQVSVSLKGASSAATDTAQVVFMDGTIASLPSLFRLVDEFEGTMKTNVATSLIPGAVTIGGIYLLHFGIATGIGLFYLGLIAGLGNTLKPLLKHQKTGTSEETSQQ